MTRGQLMKLLENEARQYCPDALNSIKRNKHMNNYQDENILQDTVEALIVDFINFVGTGQGLDLGLYTYYLHENKGTEITFNEILRKNLK